MNHLLLLYTREESDTWTRKYVNEWTIEIQDATSLVRKIYGLLQQGQEAKAKGFLPKERAYPLNQALAQHIGIR